jgi:hypothetical protein
MPTYGLPRPCRSSALDPEQSQSVAEGKARVRPPSRSRSLHTARGRALCWHRRKDRNDALPQERPCLQGLSVAGAGFEPATLRVMSRLDCTFPFPPYSAENADSEPVFGHGRAFMRNTVTSPRKPHACRMLAAGVAGWTRDESLAERVSSATAANHDYRRLRFSREGRTCRAAAKGDNRRAILVAALLPGRSAGSSPLRHRLDRRSDAQRPRGREVRIVERAL